MDTLQIIGKLTVDKTNLQEDLAERDELIERLRADTRETAFNLSEANVRIRELEDHDLLSWNGHVRRTRDYVHAMYTLFMRLSSDSISDIDNMRCNGCKIEAIKLIRKELAIGLKEAKDLYEFFIQ